MIDIVIATCNGAPYIEAQIASIQANEHYNELVTRVIVVDDHSTDNTIEIVEQLAKHDSKLAIHEYPERVGVIDNFSRGLALTDSAYVMLSDQDDIWLQHKIVTSYSRMKTVEKSAHKPCAVFSDKTIVDDKLNSICDSYFKLKKIPKTWHKNFGNLLQQNVVSGCTMICNRALINMAIPLPKGVYMHDWWMALIASKFGELELIDEPLILYRQHETNTLGAKKVSLVNYVVSFKYHYQAFLKSFIKVSEQSYLFLNTCKTARLSTAHHEASQECDLVNSTLANIFSYSRRKRLTFFMNGTIKRSHLLGNLALLVVLLTYPKKSVMK